MEVEVEVEAEVEVDTTHTQLNINLFSTPNHLFKMELRQIIILYKLETEIFLCIKLKLSYICTRKNKRGFSSSAGRAHPF
jgi:hypothetical protein